MADVLKGTDYAKYLADNLTDLEFETLIRERVKKALTSHWYYESLNGGSTNAKITIHADNSDAIEWDITAYINYSKYQTARGEILSRTVCEAYEGLARRENNKLSNLLPPPPPPPVAQEEVHEEPVRQDPFDSDDSDTGGSATPAG